MPLQPSTEAFCHLLTQILVFDLLHRFGKEGQGQHISGLCMRHTARAQIKERVLINRARSRTMATGHIVCVDLQLGLGEELAVATPELEI